MSFFNALLSDRAPDEGRAPSGYVVVDLETQRGPDEVGGWVAERMGLAVAVTWDQQNAFREWFEEDVQALVEELM